MCPTLPVEDVIPAQRGSGPSCFRNHLAPVLSESLDFLNRRCVSESTIQFLVGLNHVAICTQELNDPPWDDATYNLLGYVVATLVPLSPTTLTIHMVELQDTGIIVATFDTTTSKD